MANDRAYAYDAYSRLTCSKQATSCTSGTTRVQLGLDALDRTVTRTYAGATTTFTYQGAGELVAKAQGATTTTYAHTASGAPLGEKTGTTTLFALRDVHGDVVGRVTSTAANSSTVAYDPWGGLLSTTGTGQGLLGYQGDVTDPVTEQVDMGTRWYAPGLGRLSSRDTLFGDLSSPMTLNQHVYAGMNPITMTDPTGMLTIAGNDQTQEDAEQYNRTLCERSGGTGCDSWTNSPYTSDDGPSVEVPDPAPPDRHEGARGDAGLHRHPRRVCQALRRVRGHLVEPGARTVPGRRSSGCDWLGWRCWDDRAFDLLGFGLGAAPALSAYVVTQDPSRLPGAVPRRCGYGQARGFCWDSSPWVAIPNAAIGADAFTVGGNYLCAMTCDERLLAPDTLHTPQQYAEGLDFTPRYFYQLGTRGNCNISYEEQVRSQTGEGCT